ncbi:MAG: hypothetical protein K2X67_18055 [Burkholderiales bacterium]|nr:hypothetical protein [Burkholderiales bacterium]
MRIFAAMLFAVMQFGCASYFTARPPVIEDKVGLKGREIVGTLATAADYRVVYVKLDDKAKVCAEAPPDAAAQFSQTFAAALKTPTGQTPPLSVEARAGLAVAMKQLFKRSQGVQLFRDGAFALCNLYLNGGLTEQEYLAELGELRKSAVYLVEKEIPVLEKVTIDPIFVPTAPVPPAPTEPSQQPAAPPKS